MAAPSTRNIVPLLPEAAAAATTRSYRLSLLGVSVIHMLLRMVR